MRRLDLQALDAFEPLGQATGQGMGRMFSDQKQLKAGDTFTIDWLPGTGTLVTVRGVPQPDPVKEPAFFNALLRIWLGPSPADWKLKDALLGK